MRVEVKISIYPLPSDILPESIMYPVMTTSPLTPPLHTAWVPASHAANLYDTSYPLPSSTVLPQSPMDFSQQPHPKYILTICDDLDDDGKEEDFQTVSLEDDHWTTKEIPDRHLCIHEHSIDICAYMNIPHFISSVHTHVHTWIIHLHHTMTPLISVTFLNLKI